MTVSKLFFLVLLTASLSSCFRNFYQTNTTAKIDSVKMLQHIAEKKIFIVHTYSEVFKLSNVNTKSGLITGEKTILDPSFDRYSSPARPQANAFRKKNARFVYAQVHLYTMQKDITNGPVLLNDSLIFRVDTYGPDRAAIKQSKTISIIGFCAIPVIVIGAAAIAASSMSGFGSVMGGTTLHF